MVNILLLTLHNHIMLTEVSIMMM